MSVEVAESEEAGSWFDWTDVQLERLGCNMRGTGCAGITISLVAGASMSVVSPYFLTIAAITAFLAKCEVDYGRELIDFDNPKELSQVRARVLKAPLHQIVHEHGRYFDLRILNQAQWRDKFCRDTKGLDFFDIYRRYKWDDISGLFPEEERERFNRVWEKGTPIFKGHASKKAEIKNQFARLKQAVVDKYTRTEPRYYYANGTMHVYYVSVTDWHLARPELNALSRREKASLDALWALYEPQYKEVEEVYLVFLKSVTYNESKV